MNRIFKRKLVFVKVCSVSDLQTWKKSKKKRRPHEPIVSPRFTSPRFTSLRFTSPRFTSPVQSSPPNTVCPIDKPFQHKLAQEVCWSKRFLSHVIRKLQQRITLKKTLSLWKSVLTSNPLET